MLQWLVDQVNSLWSWIVYINNLVSDILARPKDYLYAALSWAISVAVQFTNAVKKEIADWTYGLFVNVWSWQSWLWSLIDTQILRPLANLQATLWNFGQFVYNSIVSYVSPIVTNIVSTIEYWRNTLQNQLSNLTAWLLATINTYQVWLENLSASVYNLSTIVSNIDVSSVLRKVVDTYNYVVNLRNSILCEFFNTLLEALEEKLAEAMEK